MAKRERRQTERSRFDLIKDLLYGLIRAIGKRATGFYTAFGAFLVFGVLLAAAGTWLFAELAGRVQGGATQRFDQAVLLCMSQHRVEWIERSLLEITALGTGLVVMMMVLITALFLRFTEHRYSAFLLLFSTGGGILLNNILKLTFDRQRPDVFTWSTHAASSSFPSGHAMSAAVVYGTIAFLLARLEPRRWTRALTITGALLLIGLICVSRLYLGVHYPSDVIGGVVIGLAWAAFCVAGLEALRIFAKRYRAQRELVHERDIQPAARAAEGR
jgi:undecaprenyl-diphosphatase